MKHIHYKNCQLCIIEYPSSQMGLTIKNNPSQFWKYPSQIGVEHETVKS